MALCFLVELFILLAVTIARAGPPVTLRSVSTPRWHARSTSLPAAMAISIPAYTLSWVSLRVPHVTRSWSQSSSLSCLVQACLPRMLVDLSHAGLGLGVPDRHGRAVPARPRSSPPVPVFPGRPDRGPRTDCCCISSATSVPPPRPRPGCSGPPCLRGFQRPWFWTAAFGAPAATIRRAMPIRPLWPLNPSPRPAALADSTDPAGEGFAGQAEHRSRGVGVVRLNLAQRPGRWSRSLPPSRVRLGSCSSGW